MQLDDIHLPPDEVGRDLGEVRLRDRSSPEKKAPPSSQALPAQPLKQ